MLKFAFKNLLSRKEKVILSVIAIVVATTIALISFNMSQQINDGIINTAGFYDVAIGPAGSSTDLVLNTMFFTSSSLGTIDHEIYEELEENEDVNVVIPFASGDTYKGNNIIGTTADFIKDYELKEGKYFEESYEVTIGYDIAKENKLKIGDTFVGTHGYAESGHVHEDCPYTIVGILAKTYTAYDNGIFTTLDSVWKTHDHEHEHEEGEEDHDHEHEEEEEEHDHDHDHEHEHMEGELTAILLKTKSLVAQNSIIKEYSERAGVQAVNPTIVLRDLLESIDISKVIVFALCIVIGLLAFIIVYITTLVIMQDASKDIKLMRLIGISKASISKVIYIQNIFVSVFSIIISLILSKISLAILGNITKKMGIVINSTKIYNIEWVVMIVLFILSMIPTVIQISKRFKEDPIYEK